MVDGLTRWMYSTILVVLIPFSFLNLIVRSLTRKTGYNRRRFERYGFIKRPARTGGVLVHCVSVGEVVAASKLINHMLKQDPELVVTITTTTPTGSERVKAIFADKVNHFYLPYDLHMAMCGMLRKVRPQKVLITEVELWPNFIHAAYQADIPVYVINARMTDKSCRNYKKIPLLFTPMLEKVYKVCAQGQRDYDNYLELGIEKQKLALTNNIKFDLTASVSAEKKSELIKTFNPQNKLVLLAGSTHDPEEKYLIDAYRNLLKRFPNTLLLLVPRHPQRFEKVWKLCKESNLETHRSSQYQGQNTNILLVDEMGILANLYSVAHVAFVGGSIADRGGHNALEAAIYSVPVLMGPNTYNNPEICKVLQQSGALQIAENSSQLENQISKMLSDEAVRTENGRAGFNVIDKNKGALESTLNIINAPVSWTTNP